MCAAMDINRMWKDNPQNGRECLKSLFSKRLALRIFKEALYQSKNKANNPVCKITRDWNRHFIEEYIQMSK
jgi:Zn ribbon nucleic-acid-binding protein